MDENHKTITVERPIRARTVSKSIVASTVTVAAASLTVLTKHKFATAIGASTITAIATHLIVASMMMGMVGDKTPTVAAYTGPGDIVSGAKNYWAPNRCYSSAFTGSIADIVDSSTGNTTGTRLQCGTGGVISEVVSGSACTFVTGNACSTLAVTCAVACSIVTLYDQGADAKNITQATNSKRPAYISSGVGTRGIARFAGASSQFLTVAVNTYTTSTPMITSKYTGSTQDAAFAADAGSFQAPGYNLSATAPNTAFLFVSAGLISGAASDNTWHNISMPNISAGAYAIWVDGSSANSGTAGAESYKTAAFMGSSDGTQNFFHGDIGEVAVWNTSVSSGNIGSLNTNSKAYFGY